MLITAEAFSPWFISQELTPTLYKLTHEGFVCENYYQPGWGQSTTGGEYAEMTALLPTWVGSNVSFYASVNDAMPFALGNQFRSLGYSTGAYHNNIYSYYNRDKTHPNPGWRLSGRGQRSAGDGGRLVALPDLEMVENTIGNYIDGYVNGGTPFHVYYMTVSGHGSYGWGHAMAAKLTSPRPRQPIPTPPLQVQAYVRPIWSWNADVPAGAAEWRRSIAEDTVICMSADHYPYLLGGRRRRTITTSCGRGGLRAGH